MRREQAMTRRKPALLTRPSGREEAPVEANGAFAPYHR